MALARAERSLMRRSSRRSSRALDGPPITSSAAAMATSAAMGRPSRSARRRGVVIADSLRIAAEIGAVIAEDQRRYAGNGQQLEREAQRQRTVEQAVDRRDQS